MIQSVQSGPYLDPPAEFSTQNTTSPTTQLAEPPVADKPHLPINGGIRHQQIEVGATGAASNQRVREEERETSPNDIDQPLVLTNSNGNNSSDLNCRVIPVLSSHQPKVSSPDLRRLQKTDIHFPNHSRVPSHSDSAEIHSSLESRFDADKKLENTTAWYLSPDSSPRQDSRNPRPKLGPQVKVISGSPVSHQNKVAPSVHGSTNSTDTNEVHFQQYSGTASDMQSFGSQSQQSREGSFSEYERLHHDCATRQQKVPPTTPLVHVQDDQPYYNNVGKQRKGSMPAAVGYGQLESNVDAVYSEAYPLSRQPMHKASRSFDCADILNDRLQAGGVGACGSGPKTAPQFSSPQHTKAKAMHNRVVLFNGHSPTPGAPLSPVTPNMVAPSSSSQQSRRLPGGGAGVVANKARQCNHHLEMSHSRSRSQPEERPVNTVTRPSPLLVAEHTYANTTQLPARSQHSYQHHQHHPHHHQRINGTGKSGHRRYGQEQSAFKSSYQRQYRGGGGGGGHTKSQYGGSNGHTFHHSSNGRNNVGLGPSQLQAAFSARAVDVQVTSNRTPPYATNDASQESQGTTPEAMPLLTPRQKWGSGNDIGFDSIHSGVCVSMDSMVFYTCSYQLELNFTCVCVFTSD